MLWQEEISNSTVPDLPDFIIKKTKQLQDLPTGYKVNTTISKSCNVDITVNQFV